ncbi:MAG: hypothetical protein OWU84_07040 [Firmicutes bacterium]|nr:hypothetical protein [Bacillota bacterium]
MSILAAWCVSMALVIAVERPRAAVFAWLGAAILGLWQSDDLWAVALSGAMSAAVVLAERPPSSSVRQVRPALIRFWHKVEAMASAGLTFWQAVEYAARSEPLIARPITGIAEQVAARSRGEILPDPSLGQDGPMTVLMLQHGYLHGIDGEHIRTHLRYLEEAVRAETDNRRNRAPLWMSMLSALLLLNVLWLFVAPMATLAVKGWLKVS